jgi:serine phosphatase RsbU (regulator of sigma subunit)
VTDNQLLLSRVPLFSALPPAELESLASALRTIDVAPGAVLFEEGERGSHFYIVKDGQIEIVKGLGTEDERVLGVRRPGEFVGEMSLFNRDGRRTASVRSCTNARLWEMTRAQFDGLLARQPMLAYEMVRVLSERLTNAHNNAIADLTEKNRELQQAYDDLKAAQAQIIEKEKLERELQLAAQIQLSLLPRTLPLLPHFNFGAQIAPARHVGGDLYDFIPLGENTLGIVIGDVSDKGVPAALFMSQTHALIRAEAHIDRSPSETLERVNRHLLQMNASGLFVTVLYGVLDARTRAFTYSRAGHELPLVRHRDGTITAPPFAPGAALGVMSGSPLDNGALELEPGADMLLVTDGITEARDPAGESFGEERVIEWFATNTAPSAQGMCDELLETIERFKGQAPQHDDITVAAVHSNRL